MTQDTATQTGAEELTPAYQARTSAIQQIARGVHEEYTPDLAGIDEETGQVVPYQKQESPPAPNEDEAEEQEQVQEVGAEAQDPPAKQEEKPEDDGTETIIVDGKELRVKREQLVDAGRRTLQKEAAADRRLQEATEAMNRARAYEAALLRGQPPRQDAGQDSQMPSEQDASNRGNTQGQQPSQDIETLVEHKLWDRDAQKAAKRFQTEFQDIVADPLAMRLVVQLENERLATPEGIRQDPWEAYESHGKKVREWLGKTKTQAPEIPADKTERKRSTVTVTGSGARAPQPTTPKVLTTSERIEQMRQARGGRLIQTHK